MASFGAVLDACVLVPVALADTLLRLAEHELYRPVWSQKILQETRDAVVLVHPEIDPSRVEARLHAMNEAFSDASVQGWESLVNGLTLPDPEDRHVIAAAIRGRTELIVTANIQDFPSEILSPLGLHALTPAGTIGDIALG
jgi:predicted nucleic acid-binding protein